MSNSVSADHHSFGAAYGSVEVGFGAVDGHHSFGSRDDSISSYDGHYTSSKEDHYSWGNRSENTSLNETSKNETVIGSLYERHFDILEGKPSHHPFGRETNRFASKDTASNLFQTRSSFIPEKGTTVPSRTVSLIPDKDPTVPSYSLVKSFCNYIKVGDWHVETTDPTIGIEAEGRKASEERDLDNPLGAGVV